jgi:hypothetical protein
VTADRSASTARRYLLGLASEEECSALEREYFADETALDRIAAVEEDLIEDYLAERLPPDEQNRFEGHYLASPEHRRRVEAIRGLSELDAPTSRAAAQVRRQPRTPSLRYLAIAAGVLIAAGILWMVVPRRQSAGTVAERPAPAQATEPRSNPVVLAFSLSPIAVRSATDSRSLVIAPGTDVVALQLEGETGAAASSNLHVVIQAVGGGEVWRATASRVLDLPPGVMGRFDVPAARLIADDYIVVLFDTDSAGAERERYRYVLRVRAR